MTVSNLPAFVQSLPIAEVVDKVRTSLKRGNVLLHAEPGAGKSTGLPLALLSDASPSNRILMLEPRRLAAIGVAERLAEQLGQPLGRDIGLRMRGQTTVSEHTILEVVTEGVLTRMLQSDPLLEGVGLVVFDEFHERSLHADLGLALCTEVQRELREDLRLLLMSATLDALDLKARLAPIEEVHCAGRTHPVDVIWLGNSQDVLQRRVAAVITQVLAEEAGDLLVFLPGVAEIEKTARLVMPHLDTHTVLYQLHGRADKKTQTQATAAATASRRRVILSTSIAETSLTIDGVRVVIDTGLERRGRVDSRTGAQRLETVMASQASATQRSGRAGRTEPGVCYRLWSQSEHGRRAPSWQAEIQRAELSTLLVETGLWGASDVASLPWLDAPPQASVKRAAALLELLGFWRDGRLTDTGQAAARLPLHPRLARMVLWGAKRGAAELACTAAVLLEEGVSGSETADLAVQIKRRLPDHKRRRVAQLLNLLPSTWSQEAMPDLGVVLAQGFPDWIAQRRPGAEARFVLSCGAGAYLPQSDPLAHAAWLSVASLGGATQEPRMFVACELNLDELRRWSPQLFVERKRLDWDDRLERVVAEQQTRLGALLIEAKPSREISTEDRVAALVAGIRKRGLDCLPWTDECREWQARVMLMAKLSDAGQPVRIESGQDKQWPAVDDVALEQTMEVWLAPWLNGKSTLKSLAQLDLSAVLNGILSYPQQQALASLLPVRFTVPSGSKIRLRYAGEAFPVLSVKLQEMFGCVDNPAVAQGRIPLKVELLSPARRPVQITTDLANFWTNSYPAVKKDMAGRYPKHDWPEDPLIAVPTAYAKKRRSKS